MDPIALPRPEFALAKIAKWALYKINDGRHVAYRAPFDTFIKGKMFRHEAKYILWPSAAGDVPEVTRKAFDEAAKLCEAGIQ